MHPLDEGGAGGVLALLARQAARSPERMALVQGVGADRRSITFGALDLETRRTAAWLAAHGLRAGDAMLLFHPPSIELYSVLIALFRMGGVAMVVDVSAGRDLIEAACAMVPPAALLVSPKANLLRLVSPALRRIPLVVTSGRWPIPGAHRLRGAADATPDARQPDGDPDAPALMTFTSGSTGAPKGAVRTHRFLLAQHAALAATVGAGEGTVDLVTFPVVVLANLASGATSVLPEADLRRVDATDPLPLLRQLVECAATRLSAPPALLERMLAVSAPGDERWRTLREIVTGGGPVFPELLRRVRVVAPAARILAAYGSTEAEPIAELDAADLGDAELARMRDGAGLLAGRPVAPISLRIVGARWGAPIRPLDAVAFDDFTLPPNTPGEIVVSGAHVLTGYWAGRGDEETKFRVGDAVWHRTGDVGYLDDDGRLWLLGRAAAVITDDRGQCHPFAVECAVGERWPGLRSAAVAHRGDRVLVVERLTAAPLPDPATVREALPWAALDAVIDCDRLPTDRRHNSKIDYPALAAWLDRARS